MNRIYVAIICAWNYKKGAKHTNCLSSYVQESNNMYPAHTWIFAAAIKVGLLSSQGTMLPMICAAEKLSLPPNIQGGDSDLQIMQCAFEIADDCNKNLINNWNLLGGFLHVAAVMEHGEVQAYATRNLSDHTIQVYSR